MHVSAHRLGPASAWLVSSTGRRVGSLGCITDRHPCPQEMVITNLQPETAYSITVAAYTMKGDGARSKPKVVVTKGAGTSLSPTPLPSEHPCRVLEPVVRGRAGGCARREEQSEVWGLFKRTPRLGAVQPHSAPARWNLQHPTLFVFSNVFIWLCWIFVAACKLLVAARELLHAACGM